MKGAWSTLVVAAVTLAFGFGANLLAVGTRPVLASAGDTAVLVEEDIAYEPEELTVRTGQTVQIENMDPFEHQSRVTQLLANGSLGKVMVRDHIEQPETTFAFTLPEPGTYQIRCVLHDGMVATIHVIR